MLPVEAKRNFWSGLRSRSRLRGAVDVDRLGDLGLLLAGGVADDGGEVNDRVDAVEGRLDGGRVADVALDQLEEAVLAAGQQAVAAELERVEDADAVPLFEEHRDERRADVTGSAGDENSHGEAPSLVARVRRAWNVEVVVSEINPCGRQDETGRSTRQALVLAGTSITLRCVERQAFLTGNPGVSRRDRATGQIVAVVTTASILGLPGLSGRRVSAESGRGLSTAFFAIEIRPFDA